MVVPVPVIEIKGDKSSLLPSKALSSLPLILLTVASLSRKSLGSFVHIVGALGRDPVIEGYCNGGAVPRRMHICMYV